MRPLPSLLACICGLAGIALADTCARIAARGHATDRDTACVLLTGSLTAAAAAGTIAASISAARRRFY
jgi:hypothetical protein